MNPYKVLGVSENAPPDEIRTAYLSLVKKYHPDRYTDTPLKELANEKLTEINLAYETLTKKPAEGGAAPASRGRTTSQRGYTYKNARTGSDEYSQRRAYNGPYAAELRRARELCSQNNIDAARRILDVVPERCAEWYYLYGIIYYRQSWYEKARMFLRKAYELEPENGEYRRAYLSLKYAGRESTEKEHGAGRGVSCVACPAVCSAGVLCADFCSGGCCFSIF